MRNWAQDPHLRDLAARQEGVIARPQLLDLDDGWATARRCLRSGLWVTVHPGVYVTQTGPLREESRVWAGVLYAGEGAVVSHRSALWLSGVVDEPTDIVQLSVPASRKVLTRAGLQVFRRRDLASVVHPAALPPRTRLEAAVLDATDQASSADVVLSLVLTATQRRLTTPSRLREELARRPRHRWRDVLADVLVDAQAGVASTLERRYVRDVERAHGLPRGVCNRAASGEAGLYRDVRYPEYATVAELDGRRYHPPERAFRDWRRDNLAAVAQQAALRYGWHDVVGRPCDVAAQVATVLRHRGWEGVPKRCRRCS